MTCDLVIRSYYKDLDWLVYCLRSIERFCRGFRRTVLVLPHASRARFEWARIPAAHVVYCPDYADDYLGQQVTKLTADQLTDADHICHVDSDCVFDRPTEPAALFEAGRPRILMTDYRALDRNVPWRAITERALGGEVHHEFMRTPPYTFPRWIYPALRAHVEARHGQPLERYVLGQPPRGFSEFNALGAFAYRHHRDAFHFVDSPAPARGPCRVYWSWARLDEATRQDLEALLG